MFGIQPIHILIIIVVALLIFGPSKLPEMGRNIGKAFSEFRRGTKEMTDAFQEGAASPRETSVPHTIAPPAAPLSAPASSIPTQASSVAPTAAPQPAGNFCIKCGAANPAGAGFCNQCGTKLPEKAL
jgi:TatA/E family protein of Tat protein translocase